MLACVVADTYPQPPQSPSLPPRGWAGAMCAVVLLAGLAFAVVGPLYQPAKSIIPWQGVDQTARAADLSAVAWQTFLAEHLRNGHFAWWNPHAMLGMPTLASDQAAPFFPTSFLHLLADDATALALALLVKLLSGGLGAFVLARSRGVGNAGAFAAGAAWMLGGFLPVAALTSVGNTLAVLPWCLWAGLRLFEAALPARFAVFMVLVALQFLGGSVAAAGAVCVTIGAVALCAPTASVYRRVAALILAVLGLASGALLAAMQLWPRWLHIAESVSTFDAAPPAVWGSWPMGLFSSGDPITPALFTGVGLLAALVALGAQQTRREAWRWLWIGVLSLLPAVAIAVVTRLSDQFAYLAPTQITVLAAGSLLPLAMLSALGIDSLGHVRIAKPASFLLLVLGGAAIVSLVAIFFAAKDRIILVQNIARFAVPVAGILLLMLGLARFRWIAAAVLAAELMPFAMHHWQGWAKPATPSVMAARAGDENAFMVGAKGVLPPDTAMLWGITDLRARAAVPYRLASLLAGDNPPPVLPTPSGDDPALRVLPISAVALDASGKAGPGWYPAVQSGAGQLFLRPAPPRAWIAPTALLASDFRLVRSLVSAGEFNPARTVVVDAAVETYARELLERGGVWDRFAERRGSGGAATIVDLPETERAPGKFAVDSTANGWLVVGTSYAPGWRARGGGRSGDLELAVVPAYGALQTVYLPTRMRVTFSYEPPALREGVLTSAASACLVVLLFGFSFLRRRADNKRADSHAG